MGYWSYMFIYLFIYFFQHICTFRSCNFYAHTFWIYSLHVGVYTEHECDFCLGTIPIKFVQGNFSMTRQEKEKNNEDIHGCKMQTILYGLHVSSPLKSSIKTSWLYFIMNLLTAVMWEIELWYCWDWKTVDWNFLHVKKSMDLPKLNCWSFR